MSNEISLPPLLFLCSALRTNGVEKPCDVLISQTNFGFTLRTRM